ncbi:hypothetical protein Bca52824_011696 [Brassica carinata]|uniref:Uncharacterized protein n=1 Tax=Brassica carinata TaxID=52824 RepID=A0A8X7VUM2_BRACI|nr:hypothetical protein Bca52824_011696 [Brassica carinata]
MQSGHKHGSSNRIMSHKVRSVVKPIRMGLGLTRLHGSRHGPDQVRKFYWAYGRDFKCGQSNLDLVWMDGLVSGETELRLIAVKPRSHEDSVSERLCGVWLDDVWDESDHMFLSNTK